MFEWIKGRLSEPSSYAAIGVGIIGIGIVSGVGELVFIGIGCGILGLVMREEGKDKVIMEILVIVNSECLWKKLIKRKVQ